MSQAELARKSLVDQVLNKIRTIPSYSTFHSNTFCVIAGLGLQRKAKEEGLFENADWDNLECNDAISKRIERFIIKYVR